MRVAVVAHETDHHVTTDAATRTANLVSLLNDRAHEVRVFCSKWWDGSPNTFEENDSTYHALTQGPSVPSRRFATRLTRALHDYEPDIIHATHTTPLAVTTSALTNQFNRVPLLVDWYDWRDRARWSDLLARLAVRVPDAVITPSRLVQTSVRELGRTGRGLQVIPNAIDMDLIRDAEPEHLADIVYSRTLDADSNLESLLLALAELRYLDWQAVIIGDGPYRNRYEDHAEELRIADRVEFIGTQELERRISIFKGAHVCVHTATYAPFATEFLRAIACGCVGIAEYHVDSSAHELVERRPRGFRTTSQSDLASAITEAADLPNLPIDDTYSEYDEYNFLEQYLSVYRNLQATYGQL